jgi:endogenous inhibitor of DNA gyrase (YacG/DUF329 family)
LASAPLLQKKARSRPDCSTRCRDLLLQRRGQLRMGIAQRVDRDAREPVEIAAAGGVVEVAA